MSPRPESCGAFSGIAGRAFLDEVTIVLTEPWRVQLLGQLCATQGERVLTRFRTQKTAVLLGYLAYDCRRAHPREALVELIWHEEDPEAGRNSLRVALTSLRRQLEPPGIPPGAVIVADRATVRLNPAAIVTDVAEFEAALHAATRSEDEADRASWLVRAVDLYRGDLLYGYYENWILSERERLAERYFWASGEWIALLGAGTSNGGRGDLDRALDYARRGVSIDPLREEAHREVVRLLIAAGQPQEALRQYRELERLLEEELDAVPSAATRALVQPLLEGGTAGTESRGRTVGASRSRATSFGASPPIAATSSSTRSPPQRTDPEPPLAVGSLPLLFTRFFGREEEIARLMPLLTEPGTRLVTLTGLGGGGKTRLAIEVAMRLREVFPGGVWFVPLADLAATHVRWVPGLIVGAIADALRLPRAPTVDPLEQVVAALAGRAALLVLDNFEQLADSGGPVVLTLLKRIPSLTCLATSRRRLALPGEREFLVPPLPVPEETETPERLSHWSSVQLFVDRAQAVRPDFQVTPRNAAAVVALCRCLEGIPLAIELAAARALALTPAQILERLSQRFELLTNRRAEKGSRHRSLWVAMEWSYHLLPPDLRGFFAQLYVFRGGWSLEAAEAVCDEPSALDFLARLRGHSLVLAEEGAPVMRLRLLETLREFAAEQLAPEEQAALADRHLEYCMRLAEELEPKLGGREQAACLDQLEREHDNLRAALTWSVRSGSAERGLRLGGALCPFWTMRAHPAEGRERLAVLLGMPEGLKHTDARAKALQGIGELSRYQGDLGEALSYFEGSLALRRELNDRRGIAASLCSLGGVAYDQGDYARARALYEESLSIRRELGDMRGIALSLKDMGRMAHAQGDFGAARSFHEESLATYRELDDWYWIAYSLTNIGNVAYAQGDYRAATDFHAESLSIQRELGDKWGTAYSLNNLGNVALDQGDYGAACSVYNESLAILREMGDKRAIAALLDNLGMVAGGQEDYEVARSLHEESLAIRRELGDKWGIANSLGSLGNLAGDQGDYTAAQVLHEESLAIRQELGDKWRIALSLHYLGNVAYYRGEHSTAQMRQAKSLSIYREIGDQRSSVACLEGLAGAASAQGQVERAARLFGAAEALRDSVGVARPLSERPEYERRVAATRAWLGEEAFAAAWAEGRTMTSDQATTYALEEPQEPSDT